MGFLGQNEQFLRYDTVVELRNYARCNECRKTARKGISYSTTPTLISVVLRRFHCLFK